jgi:hypothetical protein
MRQDWTYIVIRNRQKGIDQVFHVSCRGYVELDLSGEHKLMLHNEGDNKFVIEDVSLDPIKITFYPEGEERANVPIEKGPAFIFLTDRRLHVEYPSLSHLGLNGSGILNSLHMKKDDALSLDSVSSIVFIRDFQISQLVFNWKAAPLVGQGPLVIELPREGTALLNEMASFQNALKTQAQGVTFENRVVKRANWYLRVAAGCGVLLLLLFVLTIAKAKKKGFGFVVKMILLMFLCVGVAGVCGIIQGTDPEYWTISK